MTRWEIRQCDDIRQKGLSDKLGVSRIIAQLLINRGIDDFDKAETFLRGDIRELYDPFLMKGMHEAVQRLEKAIKGKERVLVHGDYDVDGITAVSLLIFTLRDFGLEADYYIPRRLTEGYGLGEAGVKEALRVGATLVVTVDCGISSHEEVMALNRHNVDVIITDHHRPPKVLPPAYCIINPHQRECAYPDRDLSGVSIAFKLCEALGSIFDNKNVWRHLDLVSLGTISDVAPLIGENRILVKEGLKLLKNGSANKGLKALIEVSGLKKKEPGSFEVAFILGPRINAIGRMDSADAAVELLLTDDSERAASLARRLNEANRERQRIEVVTLKEAMVKIEKDIHFKNDRVIVLHNEGWHRGVVGIVASRISDRFCRPAIMISTRDGVGKGSGRSVEGFHLFEALTNCGDILKEYGGHKYACGLTILEKNLSRFKKAINEIAKAMLVSEDLIPRLDIDMKIALGSVDHDLVEDIRRLEPFGEQNPRPLFCSEHLRLIRPPMVIKGEHLKLWFTDGVKHFEAIGFGLARNSDIDIILKKSIEFNLAYSVSFNSWQGVDSIQLRIKDIRPSA